MIGHVEEQDLRGADQQYGFDARRIGGKSAVEIKIEHVPQGADAAQYGRGKLAHQRAVAIRECGKARVLIRAFELAIERAAAAQHVVEDVGGNATRSKTRNLCGSCPSCRRHGFQGAWDSVDRLGTRRFFTPDAAANHFCHPNQAET